MYFIAYRCAILQIYLTFFLEVSTHSCESDIVLEEYSSCSMSPSAEIFMVPSCTVLNGAIAAIFLVKIRRRLYYHDTGHVMSFIC